MVDEYYKIQSGQIDYGHVYVPTARDAVTLFGSLQSIRGTPNCSFRHKPKISRSGKRSGIIESNHPYLNQQNCKYQKSQCQVQ